MEWLGFEGQWRAWLRWGLCGHWWKGDCHSHEETGNTNGKRDATGGTQAEASSKKPKSTMTTEGQTFVQKFKSPPSKVDKTRKLALRHWWKERMTRGRTLLTYRIGGRQTVQSYQHSRTCCVHWSLTHPTLAHLNVSLASSIQRSIPRRGLVDC